jgi:transposase
VLVDAGYVDAKALVAGRAEHQVEVLGPVPRDTRWQARAGEGFDMARFTLDWDQQIAACPRGAPSTKWSQTHDTHGHPIINARFSAATCRACPARAQCTASPTGPREITVRPKAQYLAPQAARQRQRTAAFQARYVARAGIEATISQGLRVADLRQARYVGLAKTRLQHALTAALATTSI